jgi:peptide-methionine (S)-S-oxide reductase
MPANLRGEVLMAGLFLAILGGTTMASSNPGNREEARSQAVPAQTGEEVVTLGGGCFWCLEAVFSQVKGVRSAESGYSGGTVADPTYEQVCTGTTGHAEVVQITFDPRVIPLKTLLQIFFTVHDPTTLNRQGADVGTQYRSVIFYRNAEQKSAADAAIRDISETGIWDRPIVTRVVPFQAFYKAEGYHQEYFEKNPTQPYCRVVIEPKVVKFREKFKDLLVRP